MKINKKIKILDFKLSKILNWWLFWAYKSRFTWNWMEFAEHKEYHFWDHVKDIDWKASSKTDNMFVKKYEEERDLNVLFVLDNTESMQFWSQDKTKHELLEEVFYSLWLSAYYNNDNIWWLVLNNNDLKFIDYKKSRNNIYKILDILESNNKNNITVENKVNKVLSYILERQIKDNLIFILTDETDDIDKKLLKLVWSRNEIVFINIFDVFENELFDENVDITLNSWNSFMGISLEKNKLQKYINLRERKIELLKENFNRNNIWYIDIDTSSDIFSKLIWYFSKINK